MCVCVWGGGGGGGGRGGRRGGMGRAGEIKRRGRESWRWGEGEGRKGKDIVMFRGQNILNGSRVQI